MTSLPPKERSKLRELDGASKEKNGPYLGETTRGGVPEFTRNGLSEGGGGGIETENPNPISDTRG